TDDAKLSTAEKPEDVESLNWLTLRGRRVEWCPVRPLTGTINASDRFSSRSSGGHRQSRQARLRDQDRRFPNESSHAGESGRAGACQCCPDSPGRLRQIPCAGTAHWVQ